MSVAGATKAFDKDDYKAEIDANRPVFLIASNPGAGMMHGVAGIGYNTNVAGQVVSLIVRDPASANAEDTIGLPVASINVPVTMNRRGGVRYNTEGDVSITTFDSDLEDAVMLTLSVTSSGTGICCVSDGTCVESDPVNCADLGGSFIAGAECLGDVNDDGIDDACQGLSIPAVSSWGVLMTTLLGLVAGTVMFRGRWATP